MHCSIRLPARTHRDRDDMFTPDQMRRMEDLGSKTSPHWDKAERNNVFPFRRLYGCVQSYSWLVFLLRRAGLREDTDQPVTPGGPQHRSRALTHSQRPCLPPGAEHQTPEDPKTRRPSEYDPDPVRPPAREDEERPGPSSTEHAVTVFFVCAGGFGRRLTHIHGKFPPPLCTYAQ